jgi:hypothetical protein
MALAGALNPQHALYFLLGSIPALHLGEVFSKDLGLSSGSENREAISARLL